MREAADSRKPGKQCPRLPSRLHQTEPIARDSAAPGSGYRAEPPKRVGDRSTSRSVDRVSAMGLPKIRIST